MGEQLVKIVRDYISCARAKGIIAFKGICCWNATFSFVWSFEPMPNRYIRFGDNPELTEERRSCKFDTDELAVRIYGSRKIVQDRHRILGAVEAEPQLRNAVKDLDTAFMSRMEKFKSSYENTVLAENFANKMIDRNDFHQYNYFQQFV